MIILLLQIFKSLKTKTDFIIFAFSLEFQNFTNKILERGTK